MLDSILVRSITLDIMSESFREGSETFRAVSEAIGNSSGSIRKDSGFIANLTEGIGNKSGVIGNVSEVIGIVTEVIGNVSEFIRTKTLLFDKKKTISRHRSHPFTVRHIAFFPLAQGSSLQKTQRACLPIPPNRT